MLNQTKQQVNLLKKQSIIIFQVLQTFQNGKISKRENCFLLSLREKRGKRSPRLQNCPKYILQKLCYKKKSCCKIQKQSKQPCCPVHNLSTICIENEKNKTATKRPLQQHTKMFKYILVSHHFLTDITEAFGRRKN